MTSVMKGLVLISMSLGLLFYYGHESTQPFLPTALDSGFSSDFLSYLTTSGYSQFAFNRPDIVDGCFGGQSTRPTASPKRIPIIFIHGNTDIAFGQLKSSTGARKLFQYLADQQGYTKGDLYATTWGSGQAADATLNYHSKPVVQYNRAFVEAVLSYTKSNRVHIIAHSMGVTIARKIIKGGVGSDLLNGDYDLGGPLAAHVDVFVGLAGANEGLASCFSLPNVPTCGATNGFFPGQPPFIGKSNFLAALDANSTKEASLVVTMWSTADDLIQQNCLVWGKYTPRIPNQDKEVVYFSKTHYGVRDESGEDIAAILNTRS